MMDVPCSAKTFFKKAPPGQLQELCRMLNGSDEAWKHFACFIYRRDLQGLRFSSEDIDQFAMNPFPSKALLDEWSMDRPSLGALRDALTHAGLIRQAAFVSENILKESGSTTEFKVDAATTSNVSPACSVDLRSLSHGMLQTLSLSLTVDDTGLKTRVPDSNPITVTTEPITSISGTFSRFTYHDLCAWTGQFVAKKVREGGSLLGSGGCGSVFLGRMPSGSKIAVKKLKMDLPLMRIHRQFAAEVKSLSTYVHPNLMTLLGFCDDPNHFCVVYEYLDAGNLEELLVVQESPLTAQHRIRIAVCIARAIVHLHTHDASSPLIHRDIKTANVLLDADLNPKLGDFGLARLGPERSKQTHEVTENIIGTTVYMPPEYVRNGKVSMKLDAYSYGVVLLELLVGQRAYDPQREDEEDIITYVECQRGELSQWLDPRVEDWPQETVASIYEAAFGNEQCLLSYRYDQRTTITQIMPDIENWIQSA